MMRIFFILILCLANLTAVPLQDRTISNREEIFQFFRIDQTAIVEETQAKWLRPSGKERWEINELPEEQRVFVIDWAKKQGLFDSWMPSRTHYDQALILGASTPSLKIRIEFLKELWETGYRFDGVTILTGDRPLDPRIDEWTNICKTETDAALYYWNRIELPAEMRALPVHFFSVPMKKEKGILVRPNTADTVIGWANKAEPCSCLFISKQPDCGYQFAVIKHSLPPDFLFDVAGKQTKTGNAAVILDMLARWIYEDR